MKIRWFLAVAGWLKYGILVLGLAMICGTFWLIFGVTLAALIIVVNRLWALLKKTRGSRPRRAEQ
jgi:hypothetical protein